MSWTYGADPANSTLDAARLLLGDTDSTDQQFTDSELNYFISLYPTSFAAAAMAARSAAAKYARLVDKSLGDLKIAYSQRHRQYLLLSESLDTQASMVAASPFLGGASIADKESMYEDSDRVQSYFRRDQFDNPGAVDTDISTDD